MTEDEVAGPESSDLPAEQDSLDLSGVYLLTAESDWQTAVPGLGLVVDRDGLTVRKPNGEVTAALGWAQVSRISAVERMRTPVGRLGLVLEVTTATKPHRFVIPVDDPDALENGVARLVAAYGSQRATRARWSRVLVGLITVILAAGVTIAILVAAGVVKF